MNTDIFKTYIAQTNKYETKDHCEGISWTKIEQNYIQKTAS